MTGQKSLSTDWWLFQLYDGRQHYGERNWAELGSHLHEALFTLRTNNLRGNQHYGHYEVMLVTLTLRGLRGSEPFGRWLRTFTSMTGEVANTGFEFTATALVAGVLTLSAKEAPVYESEALDKLLIVLNKITRLKRLAIRA